jgi:DNA-binding NarL/FixJ family response regulator
MKKPDYGSVKMLLAIENPIVRKGLLNTLQHEGFYLFEEASSFETFVSVLAEQSFDVIVTATEISGQFIPPHIARLRQGTFGQHPLPIVIELLVDSDADYVRKVIDSGPDDLLQLPIAPGQLLSRLMVLAEKRKPFIVTSDYVGPDRRQTPRQGASAQMIEVPNPLALKIAQQGEAAVLEVMTAAGGRLRQMRIARFAFELQWLLRAIRQLFQSSDQDARKLETFCGRIKTLLTQLPPLLAPEASATIAPLSERLTLGTGIVVKNGFSADATVLNGLGGLVNGLTQAMLATLSPEVLEASGIPR